MKAQTIRPLGVVRLRKGRSIRFRGAAGRRLVVRDGELWITQHDDARDHVARPGHPVDLTGLGVTLAYAFEDSAVEFVDVPRPSRGLASRLRAVADSLLALR